MSEPLSKRQKIENEVATVEEIRNELSQYLPTVLADLVSEKAEVS